MVCLGLGFRFTFYVCYVSTKPPLHYCCALLSSLHFSFFSDCWWVPYSLVVSGPLSITFSPLAEIFSYATKYTRYFSCSKISLRPRIIRAFEKADIMHHYVFSKVYGNHARTTHAKV